jgi:outer membrane lipoprotein carrier protein
MSGPGRHFRRLGGAAAVLGALLATLAAAATPERPVPDPNAPGLSLAERSRALLDRIQREQKQLVSLEADFVQSRTSEFLVAPEESRGTFVYSAPDLVRWDYVAPRSVSLVIHDDEMLTWYRELRKAERVKVGKVSSQVFRYLNASGSLESLMKYFAVTISFPEEAGEPYRLRLAPRYARIKKRLSGMELWIDRELYLPVRVRYEEANGDSTDYRFEKLRKNGPVPRERFDLQIPAEVEVRLIELDRGRPAEPQ